MINYLVLHDYFNFENDLGYILILDPMIIQDSIVARAESPSTAEELSIESSFFTFFERTDKSGGALRLDISKTS